MPQPSPAHRVCPVCGSYAGKEVVVQSTHDHSEHDHDHE